MLSIALAAALAQADAKPAPPISAMCEQAQPATGGQSASVTSTANLVRDWLDAVGNADDAAFVRFVQDRGPVLRGGPDDWLRLRGMLRGVRPCGIQSANKDTAGLWVFVPQMESFGIAEFKLPAAPADKPELRGIRLTGDTPPGFSWPRLSAPALAQAIDERLTRQARDGLFSGAVLIARNGQVLFQHAYGLADREAGTPNDLDTQFRFGSMGKMLTMVAIMQLVQDGKIDLAASIGHYLADYPNQDVAAKVTVANLLTHTGGTGDIFGPDFDAHKAALRDLKDYVDLYGKRELEFAPGSRVAYSNYGFILLGRIVEAVSGLSYDAYLQRNIFDPAGMSSTGNLPESTVLPHRAVAYMGPPGQVRRADDTLPVRGTSAGGGYSTVGDFNRFAEALASHKLLRAETLRQLMDGGVKTADGQFIRYDFGGTIGTEHFFGHGGGAPGMNGALYHFVDSGYTVVVLANRDPPAADQIATFAVHRLPEK